MLLAPDFAIYFYIAGSVSVTILRVLLANPYGAMVKERPLGRTCPIFLGADFCPHGYTSYLTRVESKIKINTEAWEDGLAGKALVEQIWVGPQGNRNGNLCSKPASQASRNDKVRV